MRYGRKIATHVSTAVAHKDPTLSEQLEDVEWVEGYQPVLTTKGKQYNTGYLVWYTDNKMLDEVAKVVEARAERVRAQRPGGADLSGDL